MPVAATIAATIAVSGCGPATDGSAGMPDAELFAVERAHEQAQGHAAAVVYAGVGTDDGLVWKHWTATADTAQAAKEDALVACLREEQAATGKVASTPCYLDTAGDGIVDRPYEHSRLYARTHHTPGQASPFLRVLAGTVAVAAGAAARSYGATHGSAMPSASGDGGHAAEERIERREASREADIEHAAADRRTEASGTGYHVVPDATSCLELERHGAPDIFARYFRNRCSMTVDYTYCEGADCLARGYDDLDAVAPGHLDPVSPEQPSDVPVQWYACPRVLAGGIWRTTLFTTPALARSRSPQCRYEESWDRS